MQLEPIGSGWAAPGGRRPEQPAARGPNRGRRVSESQSQGPAPSPRPCGVPAGRSLLLPRRFPQRERGVGGPMASRGPALPRCGGRAAESPPQGRPGPRAWAPAAQHSPAATTGACSASTATRRPRGDPHGRRPFRGGTSGSALTAAALPARWGRGPGGAGGGAREAQGAGPRAASARPGAVPAVLTAVARWAPATLLCLARGPGRLACEPRRPGHGVRKFAPEGRVGRSADGPWWRASPGSLE